MTDSQDFDIIKAIVRDPFVSLNAIGESLGLSGVTVKARLERLQRLGALRMWTVPAPQVFRRHARFFVYGRVDAGKRALDLARRSETVVRAAVGHERSFELVACETSEDAPPPQEIVRRLGDPIFAASFHLGDPKASDCVLSPLDWRILLPLVRNPRATPQDLATITGLSRKTVRLHRDALFRKQLLHVFPMPVGGRAPGFVIYRLFLWVSSTSVSDRERIRKALPSCLIAGWTERPAGLWLVGAAPTMADVVRAREFAETLPGVLRAEFDVFVRNEMFPERIEGWIRAELERWEDARRRR